MMIFSSFKIGDLVRLHDLKTLKKINSNNNAIDIPNFILEQIQNKHAIISKIDFNNRYEGQENSSKPIVELTFGDGKSYIVPFAFIKSSNPSEDLTSPTEEKYGFSFESEQDIIQNLASEVIQNAYRWFSYTLNYF